MVYIFQFNCKLIFPLELIIKILFIIKEKIVASGKILDTNQAISMIIERVFNQFILNHQDFLYENFNRRNSILDRKMEGKKIRFEELFCNMNINKEIKEND